MNLAPGTRIGPYEIVSMVGAGGMGEVYRAHDARLGRDVALKILPPVFASDPDRIARFDREARTLATLNHPHIGAIYGVEETNGVRALALEFVEGETLADRIARGPLPLDEALPVAQQIADALEAAHEHGIIHRDLKPSNIKLREDGTVKVLDFGLAKALDRASSSAGEAASSPTITSPAMTQLGVILGTAAYMSPEQAKGGAADRRSDIWAFGCVLFEMLAGKRAFGDDDATETLAAVLKTEPDLSFLPVNPPLIVDLLRRCLAKDPRLRISHIAVARFAIEEASVVRSRTLSAVNREQRAPHPWVGIVVAVVLSSAAGAAAVWWVTDSSRQPDAATRQVTRFPLVPPPGVEFGTGAFTAAITRDGRRIVFGGMQAGMERSYVRPIEALDALPIRGTEGRVGSVVLSPDGQWLLNYDLADRSLKKIRIDNGHTELLCRLPGTKGTIGFGGATWGSRGTIVFSVPGSGGLMRVSHVGGTPQRFTSSAMGESHSWPQFLPDGRRVLFVRRTFANAAEIAVAEVDTGAVQTLLPGTSAQYVGSGHILYVRDNALWAVPFDVDRLKVGSPDVPVLDDVAISPIGVARLTVSDNGTLVYIRGSRLTRVVLVDMRGEETVLPNVPADDYSYVRVSPANHKIAFQVGRDISVYDIQAATLSKVTADSASDQYPLWFPDGHRLIFMSARNGQRGLYTQLADGSGIPKPLLAFPSDIVAMEPDAFSPDGKRMLVTVLRAGNYNLATFTLGAESTEPLLTTDYNEARAALSPDGRWVAYHSNASGQYEVYVERFPRLGQRGKISTGGGVAPVWAHEGGRLFYRSTDGQQIFQADAPAGDSNPFKPGRPLVRGSYGPAPPFSFRDYDLMPDGQRFVMITPAKTEGSQKMNVVVVQNWFDELKRRVPTQ